MKLTPQQKLTADLCKALRDMIAMAMHAPLNAGHGRDQSHIDTASATLARALEMKADRS